MRVTHIHMFVQFGQLVASDRLRCSGNTFQNLSTSCAGAQIVQFVLGRGIEKDVQRLVRGCRCGNQEIYRRLRLVPRVMRNVAEVQTETAMLGHKMSFPVYISAAAKGGLAHADAEEALCRAAFARQTIQMCPHMATKTLEQMAAARARAALLLQCTSGRSACACAEVEFVEIFFQSVTSKQ